MTAVGLAVFFYPFFILYIFVILIINDHRLKNNYIGEKSEKNNLLDNSCIVECL